MHSSLEDMLDSARRLQKTYYDEDDKLMHRLASGCMANLSQAMHLDWKMVSHDTKKEREKLMGMVDAFHYILSLMSCVEDDSSKLYRTLMCRRVMIEELHKSFEGIESLLEKDLTKEKIAIVDIDNVLYPYDEVWSRFQESLGCPDDISRDECKERYRVSGLKALTPPLNGAKRILNTLQAKGFIVILLSARAVDLYPEVYVDTLEFLRTYTMPHDHLLFKKEKRGGAILPKLLKNTDLFIDDQEEQINWALDGGANTCVHVQDGSAPSTHPDVVVATNLKELWDFIKRL